MGIFVMQNIARKNICFNQICLLGEKKLIENKCAYLMAINFKLPAR